MESNHRDGPTGHTSYEVYNNYCNSMSGFFKYKQNLISHLQEDNNSNDSFNVSGGWEAAI